MQSDCTRIIGGRHSLLEEQQPIACLTTYPESALVLSQCSFTVASFLSGDVVQVAMHNNCDFQVVLLAIWMAGGVTSLSDPILSTAIMRSQIEAINAKVIVCSPTTVDAIKEATTGMEEIPIIVVNAEKEPECHQTLEKFIEDIPEDCPVPVGHKSIKVLLADFEPVDST